MWLVCGIYGYGYHVYVWLVGVVVRRYIDIFTIIINFPYSTCISFFWQQHPYFFVHFIYSNDNDNNINNWDEYIN